MSDQQQFLAQKPELSTVERIAIPGLLVGALYSAYATALTGIRYANDVRNFILQLGVSPERPLPKIYAVMVYKDDWIPIWIGNSVYCFLVMTVILWVPGFVMQHRHFDKGMRRNISALRYVCALLPLVGLIGNIWGGINDRQLLLQYMDHLPR